MVKILHVINGAGVGGISSMLLNYYKFIDRNNYHFDFATSTENGHNGDELEKLGARFYYIGKKSDNLKLYLSELDNLIKREKYDVVHVHSNLTSFVALFVAWKNRVPIRIAHGHNAMPAKMSFKEKISRKIANFLIAIFATKRVACSKNSALYTFGNNLIKKKNVQILPNAIDLNLYSFKESERFLMRSKLNISEEEIVIGCVGRMSPEKNQEFLIKVFSKLKLKINNVKLILVGNGINRKMLEKMVDDLLLSDCVIFTGERSDVGNLLSALDIFALPSLSEGLGIVAIEAAAAGLPVILSENITSELDFIPNSHFVTLDIDEWVLNLEIMCRLHKRNDNASSTKILKKNGYDILEEAKVLESLYDHREVE